MSQPDSILLAVVPSVRVSASDFVTVLRDNGVRVTSIGSGTATVQVPRGRHFRVAKTRVVAILSDDLRRVRAHAKLCGIIVTGLEIKVCPSRANVV